MDHRKSRILMLASFPAALVFLLLALLLAPPESEPVLPVDEQGNITITFEVQRIDEQGRAYTAYLDENGNEVSPPANATDDDDGLVSLILVGLSIACLAAGQIQFLIFCRCPYCGGALWRVRGLHVAHCPDCGQEL